jgi:transcriptional regulator with XRE-family HTH domain
MKIAELIALAKVRSGKSQKDMAHDMGYSHPQQLSKIAAGVKAPDASEIIYLATAAQMEPIKVLAEIESERHPELAFVWGRALLNSAAL